MFTGIEFQKCIKTLLTNELAPKFLKLQGHPQT